MFPPKTVIFLFSIGEWIGDDVEHLQSRIVILVAERDKLRKQVSQLTLNTESVNEFDCDTVENASERNVNAISLKCRLEVIFERIRSLLEVSIPENESYCTTFVTYVT
jgi:hypothetical protein